MSAAASTAAKRALKPIQIFRPGRHKPVKGDAVAFSDADLRDACAAYDPALHRAPIVIGHPKQDDPAWGHIESLSYADDAHRVIAHPTEVDPAFADWVASGKLLSVSAMWYTPTAPNNPVPGKYYLRHVGFLGAEAPAVKGLERPAVAFADADEEGCIEFSDWADEQVAGLFGRLRDWLISTLGLEKADEVLPSYAIDSIKREAAQEAMRERMKPESSPPATAGLSYADTGAHDVTQKTPEQLAAEAAALQTQRAQQDAREAALTKRERDAHRSDMAAFADGLVQEGRLLPKDRNAVVELMASLPTGAEAELAFSEGGEEVKKPPLQVLQGFLKGLLKQVEFSERAAPDKKPGVDTDDAHAIANAALAFQDSEAAAGRTVSLEAAVQHVIYSNQQA